MKKTNYYLEDLRLACEEITDIDNYTEIIEVFGRLIEKTKREKRQGKLNYVLSEIEIKLKNED